MVQSAGSSTASLKPQRLATHHSLRWRCKPRHSAHFNGAEPRLVASSSHSHSTSTEISSKPSFLQLIYHGLYRNRAVEKCWRGPIPKYDSWKPPVCGEMFSTVSFQYYSLSLFWAPGLKPASLNNSSIMAIWSRKWGFIMNPPVCLGNDHHVGTALTPHL